MRGGGRAEMNNASLKEGEEKRGEGGGGRGRKGEVTGGGGGWDGGRKLSQLHGGWVCGACDRESGWLLRAAAR
jgi:hypothetical protein